MSSALVNRVLRVGLIVHDDSRREALSAMLQDELGHEVVLACATLEAFQKELATTAELEIVLTNLASVATIQDLERMLAAAGRPVPLVVVNEVLDNLLAVNNLASVFGCHVYPERSKDLAAGILLAWSRYEADRALRAQLVEAQEQGAQAQKAARDKMHAIGILIDYHKLSSYKEGAKLLQEIVSSHNDKMPKRVKKIIDADKVMRPRKSRRQK